MTATEHPQITEARELLARETASPLPALVDELVATGEAEWVLDPEVKGVVGLVRAGTRRALAVAYLHDADLEVSDELEDLLYT